MQSFTYYNPAKIIFGKDSQKQIAALLKEYRATSVMMIYSGDFVRKLGIWDEVKNACDKMNISFHEDSRVVPNPKVELVREIISSCKKNNVDFILAVGGGSAIDTAKAVSIGALYEGDVWDFFTGKANAQSSISIGVISTIPASGSESSNAAIITNGLYKCGVETDLIIPKFAIMNPEYTLGLPDFQTFSGIADIFSHLLERYFTMTEYVDTTDFLLEGAIKALILNASRLKKNPADYNARAEIQWLACIAHNNILDTGRATDWASHRVEHELSGQYNITHGEGMAIVLVAYVRYMAKLAPEKMAQLANRVYDVDYHDYSTEEMALILAEKLKSFFSELGLATSLAQLNIDSRHFDEMAQRATGANGTVGHYIPLDKKAFIEVLNLCL